VLCALLLVHVWRLLVDGGTLRDYGLFYLVDFTVLLHGMLPQISHVEINVQLLCSFIYIIFNFSDELFIDFLELNQELILSLTLLLYRFLMLDILLSNMMEKVAEKPVVIYYQFIDDCPVDVR
jgi:hypothetical protein